MLQEESEVHQKFISQCASTSSSAGHPLKLLQQLLDMVVVRQIARGPNHSGGAGLVEARDTAEASHAAVRACGKKNWIGREMRYGSVEPIGVEETRDGQGRSE